MKIFYTLLLATFILVCNAQTEQEVSITNDSITLFGSLLLPETNEKPKVVLIIAGSGPTDRNGNNPMMKNNSLKMIAEELADNGIASLRYDKRGIGKSKVENLKEEDLDFNDFVEDAQSWVEYLDNSNKYSEIIVLGHSEGATIGNLVSKEDKVDGFISLAGPGRNVDELFLEQLQLQAPLVVDESKEILDTLKQGKRVEKVSTYLMALFRPSVQPFLISMLQVYPAEEIAKIEKPVLIVQGTTDIQVKEEDAELLHKGSETSKLVIIDGMNHVLKLSSDNKMENMATYANPTLELHKDLMPALVDFINSL